MNPRLPIVLVNEDITKMPEATLLAHRLGIPLANTLQGDVVSLVMTPYHLELRLPDEKLKPIFVDFLAKHTLSRLQKLRGRNELIAKAIGIKSKYIPTVLDATAGLGGDATVLATLGCQVTMVERSPIICALLEDGINRARQIDTKWLPNLSLLCMDSIQYMNQQITMGQRHDVIYLDPMFPVRTKSSLVKKEMRILKEIVGSDEDAPRLLEIAKQCAKKRIVVKRPRLAPTLTEEKPSIVYMAKACRFDTYLIQTA